MTIEAIGLRPFNKSEINGRSAMAKAVGTICKKTGRSPARHSEILVKTIPVGLKQNLSSSPERLRRKKAAAIAETITTKEARKESN